jgi:CheY-like chemotaxis protein
MRPQGRSAHRSGYRTAECGWPPERSRSGRLPRPQPTTQRQECGSYPAMPARPAGSRRQSHRPTRTPIRHRPAVVLMDVRLGSGLDGIESVRKIRQSHPCKVIFLTGSNETTTRLRIETTDPTGVLVKPILPQHLIGHSNPCRDRLDGEPHQGEQYPSHTCQAWDGPRCDSQYSFRTERDIVPHDGRLNEPCLSLVRMHRRLNVVISFIHLYTAKMYLDSSGRMERCSVVTIQVSCEKICMSKPD